MSVPFTVLAFSGDFTIIFNIGFYSFSLCVLRLRCL